MASRLEKIIAEEEKKTSRQISKEYNDALQSALRKTRDFFKRADAVDKGRIKPPSGLKTEAQINGWKQAYKTRAAKQAAVVEKITDEMKQAGVKTRSRIVKSMTTIYDKTRKVTNELLNKTAKADLPEMSKRQIQSLLYGKGSISAFSKVAFNRLGNGQNVASRLRREMAQSIAKNESKDQLLKRIMKATGAEESDAKRIMRTESTRIQSMAQQEAAEEHSMETGRKAFKTWHCIFQNSRETHMDMDGQTVEINQTFQSPSGAELMYPGDDSAPADEVVNCQCYMEVHYE